VAESDTFWLSETPKTPGSKSWDTACERACTWGRFVDKQTGRSFYLYNTHLDHVSEHARQRGAELIAQRIAARKHDDPVILTGDLNSGEDSLPIRYLTGRASMLPDLGDETAPSPALVDSFRIINPDTIDVGTLSRFTGTRQGGKIDYVLVEPTTTVLDAEIVFDNKEGRYPSDHYPVTARILLPAQD
jgi:endonuclease/exonuclease/phosphatase family metal-dependent hydrolase